MSYEEKDYSDLLGLEGFSDKLLNTHFKLYSGYVKNTNKLSDMLGNLDKSTSEYAELKRRFGWEFNGMRLHELYFSNMSKDGSIGDEDSKDLRKKMEEEFGSEENSWKDDFVATSSLRGIGWCILYYDPIGDRLHNTWINEHDIGHLSGGIPLLVLDVFEHAFIMDYDMNRADYIAAFFKVIDWKEVSRRYQAAKQG